MNTIQLDKHYKIEFFGDGFTFEGEIRRTLAESAGLAIEKIYEAEPNRKLEHIAAMVLFRIIRHTVETQYRAFHFPESGVEDGAEGA